jgi:hypothetical protein
MTNSLSSIFRPFSIARPAGTFVMEEFSLFLSLFFSFFSFFFLFFLFRPKRTYLLFFVFFGFFWSDFSPLLLN